MGTGGLPWGGAADSVMQTDAPYPLAGSPALPADPGCHVGTRAPAWALLTFCSPSSSRQNNDFHSSMASIQIVPLHPCPGGLQTRNHWPLRLPGKPDRAAQQQRDSPRVPHQDRQDRPSLFPAAMTTCLMCVLFGGSCCTFKKALPWRWHLSPQAVDNPLPHHKDIPCYSTPHLIKTLPVAEGRGWLPRHGSCLLTGAPKQHRSGWLALSTPSPLATPHIMGKGLQCF